MDEASVKYTCGTQQVGGEDICRREGPSSLWETTTKTHNFELGVLASDIMRVYRSAFPGLLTFLKFSELEVVL